MQIWASQITKMPVFDIALGKYVAWTNGIIFDPQSLRIKLFKVQSRKDQYYIRVEDISEIIAKRILIKSQSEISEADDLIRYQPLIEQNLTMIGLPVFSDTGKKLGVCKDLLLDSWGLDLSAISLRPSLINRLLYREQRIDALQIKQVLNDKIIIQTPS